MRLQRFRSYFLFGETNGLFPLGESTPSVLGYERDQDLICSNLRDYNFYDNIFRIL